jgi:type IV pilus assembly protein PilM
MAHRILGLDIGRRTLKLAIVDKTLRSSALTGWDEEPLPHNATDDTRAAALKRLMDRNMRPDDVLAVSMPTDAVMHRVLTFPFRDDKSIEEAVGFELENHIPVAVSDLCVDYTRIGEKDGQTEILAIAAHRETVQKYLDWLRSGGIEPRRLGLTALAYASLVRKLPDMTTGWTLMCDIGTRSTDVVLLNNGKTEVVRSLSVGSDSVAQIFAGSFQSDKPNEEVLIDHAWLLPGGATAENNDERKLDQATRDALEPLTRELRQTLAYAMRRSRVRPNRMIITGGLCRLAGLDEYLERALGLQVTGVRLGELPDQKLSESATLGDRGALAVALALAAADPAASDDDVDFRQGELAYEGDFKVLRARLPMLGAFAVLVVLLLGVRAGLTWKALATEQDAQVAHLEAVSKALIGKTSGDFEYVQKELSREPNLDVASLYPDMSAFKVLEVITEIIDKVTEPPDAIPGGPGEPSPPSGSPVVQMGPQGALGPAGAIGDPSMRTHPMIRPQVVNADEENPPPPDPRTERPNRSSLLRHPQVPEPTEMGTPTSLLPPAERKAAEKKDADKKDKDKDGDDKDEDHKKSGEPFSGHKIELSAVQIERTGVTMRGEADTQDALLALQSAIDGHKCFSKVKSSSDRITFERHRDWFKFTMQFEVACPQPVEKKAKVKIKPAAGEDAPDKGKKDGKSKKDEAEEET